MVEMVRSLEQRQSELAWATWSTLSQNKHRRHSTSRGGIHVISRQRLKPGTAVQGMPRISRQSPEARKRLEGTSLQVSEGHDPVDISDFF